MKISIVAAISQNNVIGKNGKIPWHISADLKRFKEITKGHHILMGRKTFESIGKPLPERTNLIITSNKNYKVKGAFVFNDPQKAVLFAQKRKEKELMIIGGQKIYEYFINKADKIYLTKIFKNFKGDALFPKIDQKEWKFVSKETHKENRLKFTFFTLERKEKPIIIGVTGTNGAGKGTVVGYLVKEKGFKHYSVSDFLSQKLKEKGKEINRDNLREIANQIREKFGGDYIVKKLFIKAKKEGNKAIIESVRNIKEAMFIKKKGGILLAVDAPVKKRFERIKKRSSLKDDVSFKEFLIQEKKEMENKDPNSQNLKACIKMADYKLLNNAIIEKLYEKVEKTISQIR
ncbi:MAG: hypothetical protein KatS3mg088_677 [Patescibacteria group bacterium]|nr:MAG: hypothetical protein KatS3mg088_677 [Patescibacteria group bacterium]